MSVTLRDAQHLCWKTFKKLEIVDKKGSAAFENVEYLLKKAAEVDRKIKAPQKRR